MSEHRIPKLSMGELCEIAKHCVESDGNDCNGCPADNIGEQCDLYSYCVPHLILIMARGHREAKDKLNERIKELEELSEIGAATVKMIEDGFIISLVGPMDNIDAEFFTEIDILQWAKERERG